MCKSVKHREKLVTSMITIGLMGIIWILINKSVNIISSINGRHLAAKSTNFWISRDDDLNSTSRCSPDILKTYYRKLKCFPGEGLWADRKQERNLARFQPDICKFSYDNLPPRYLSNCLKRRNISRIVTMGDSNGAGYYTAILNHLQQDGAYECTSETSESVDRTLLKPDPVYYSRRDSKLMSLLHVTFRHCSSCVARTHLCRPRSGAMSHNAPARNLETEHLAMISVMDSSIKLNVPHNHFAVNMRYRADTYQEFVLKYHLKNRFPDLLIIFPPFNHDKLSESIRSIEIRLRYFHALLHLYLPRTTRVFWIPAFREFENRKSKVWAHRKMAEGLSATDKIDLFNRKLFQIIRRDLTKNDSFVYGFFDLIRLSENLDDLSTDGIHLHEIWYQRIASYIIQILCSSNKISLNK